MNPDDEDLDRIRPQNEADIEWLIKKYHCQLKFAAVRMLRRKMPPGAADAESEAEDVLQEVYMAAWHRGIENISKSLINYLMGAVRHKVVDRVRRGHIQVELNETIGGVRKSSEEGLVKKVWREHQISRLDPQERQIILLSIEGHSTQEIAELLGISESAAKSRLFRAKQKLKE